MTDPDVVAAVVPVLDALTALGARHFIGGSLASSAHGLARASIDADVVAGLRPEHVAATGAAEGRALPFSSAEDVVLAKLEWYRRGGEVSERQWTDVLGVLRVCSGSIDRAYLSSSALELGVDDLLARAFSEAAEADSQ